MILKKGSCCTYLKTNKRGRHHAFPLSLGSRPAFFKASWIIHSNCPLVLLNLSAAHFSTAFISFSSSLKAQGFLLGMIYFVLVHYLVNGVWLSLRYLGS